MKVWVCKVCGYVHMGPEAPDECPQCHAPKSKFFEKEDKSSGKIVWADEHKIGVAQGLDAEVVQGLRENFAGCFTKEGAFDIKTFAAQIRDKVSVAEEGYQLDFLGKNYARSISTTRRPTTRISSWRTSAATRSCRPTLIL